MQMQSNAVKMHGPNPLWAERDPELREHTQRNCATSTPGVRYRNFC